MKGLWYGDRRDRVKWGALIYLAEIRAIPQIVQVAYYRRGPAPVLKTQQGEVPLPLVVWNHFSNLQHIQQLGKDSGKTIHVLDNEFVPSQRSAYVGSVVHRLRTLGSPKIVFLDPDTGIEPGTAGPEHVTKTDAEKIWFALVAGDVLVIYQHANRTASWQRESARTMSSACGGAAVNVIDGKSVASDVAMLYCEKGNAA